MTCIHIEVTVINKLNKSIINNKLKILTTPIHPQSWSFRTITIYRMGWRRVSVEMRRAGMKWEGPHGWWKEWDTCWAYCPGTRGRGRTQLMVNMHVCGASVCMFRWIFEGIYVCVMVFAWCLVLSKFKSAYYFLTTHLVLLMYWWTD